METDAACLAFAALAQPNRLAVFRLLVQAGPEGLAAGRIAEILALPPATLSFHLKELARAGLVTGETQGRFVIYRAGFAAITGLIAFLAENCCAGRDCGVPVAAPLCETSLPCEP